MAGQTLETLVSSLELLIEQKQAEVAHLEERLAEPRQELQRLRQMLSAANGGGQGPSRKPSLTDSEIVAVLETATAASPMSAPQIAGELGIDTRALSPRLPRMARDGLIVGSPAEGYYTPA